MMCRHDGIKRVGLLGTAFTMERDFYKGRLSEMHGIDVVVPDAIDRTRKAVEWATQGE